MGRTRQESTLRIADCGLRIRVVAQPLIRNPQSEICNRWRIGLWLVTAIIILAGCEAPLPLRVCPGKNSADEALKALSDRAEQAGAFRAGGQCRLAYHVSGETGVKRDGLSLPVVVFCPPSYMYVRGSLTVDPKAVIVGSNSEEFWLALRPKEISSYYWGRWDQATNAEGPMINPGIVLEALGVVARNDANAASWSFEKQGPYDVLTQLDAAGRPVRRLQIYTCDYLVRKMEYFGRDGAVVAVAELAKYRPVTGSFQVPTEIRVTTIDRDRREDTIDIQLDSPKPTTLTEQARQQMFKREPNDVQRFEHVYRLENGRWILQEGTME